MTTLTTWCLALTALLPLGVFAQPATVPTAVSPAALLTGSIYELTTTDGQGRISGRVQLRAVALRCTGTTTHATLRQEVFGLSDHPLYTAELPARFSGAGPALLDARTFVNGALLAALHLQDLDLTEDSLAVLPRGGARPGQGLASAYLSFTSPAGQPPRSVQLTLLGRCLGETETLTTPAGTFQCERLTQLLEIERFDNGIQRRHSLRLVCWVAPNAGVVRAETYAGNTLFDSTLLTRIRPGETVPTAVAAKQ